MIRGCMHPSVFTHGNWDTPGFSVQQMKWLHACVAGDQRWRLLEGCLKAGFDIVLPA